MINEIKKIGFIGIGVMGASMASHLLKAGYELHIYTRTSSKAEPLIEQGAIWQASPAQLAVHCDAIITMIGYPQDVEEIYLGENGLITNCKPGTILIDMTTSSPKLAAKIAEEAMKKKLYALDAPVSGGDIGAQQATLSIMVGGAKDAFEYARPILEKLGKNIVLQGEAGAGQHTKMCNQIAIASGMVGVCEAIIYTERAGLDPTTVLQSIQTGGAGSWSLSNLAPRIIEGNFEPGFYIKHFIKDMRIALQTAVELGVEMPGLALALSLYEDLERQGLGEKGTQALYHRLNR